MFAFLRGKGPVTHQTPPHEPSAAERGGDRERRIEQLNQAMAWAAAAGDWETVDQLLDARNRVRPARVTEPGDVPVIPGRTT